LEQLASTPRFAGSEFESRARKLCSAHLEGSGLATIERPFSFSEFPGKYGVPLVGFLLAIASLHARYAYSAHGPVAGLLALILGVLIVFLVSRWLTRHGTSDIRSVRSQSVNVIARRGNPKVWLVAHLDSKSQAIPMLVRIASVVLIVILITLFAVLLIAGAAGARLGGLILALGIACALAAMPFLLCFTGNRSNGAADNASGVAAILLAVRLLPIQRDVAVILTSGEELGLTGARFFVASQHEPAVAINCDTVDDDGRFLCMTSGKARRTSEAMSRAAARLGMDVRIRSMLPGILADSMAFTDAGWDSVTLSRGNIATLTRVHTSRDTAAAMTGTGIAKAARLLAATVEELS
jgi:hypothetical protein